jgi:hypothetical protein
VQPSHTKWLLLYRSVQGEIGFEKQGKREMEFAGLWWLRGFPLGNEREYLRLRDYGV